MNGRYKSSNRQGNKLSSERDDRYVKEKQKKESKAKWQRKVGAFEGGGEQVAQPGVTRRRV